MTDFSHHKHEIIHSGFTVIDNVFSEKDVDLIIETIQKTDTSKPTFRKTNDLFAIRQFLKEVPEAFSYIFIEA